jgi:hypothetical protein
MPEGHVPYRHKFIALNKITRGDKPLDGLFDLFKNRHGRLRVDIKVEVFDLVFVHCNSIM